MHNVLVVIYYKCFYIVVVEYAYQYTCNTTFLRILVSKYVVRTVYVISGSCNRRSNVTTLYMLLSYLVYDTSYVCSIYYTAYEYILLQRLLLATGTQQFLPRVFKSQVCPSHQFYCNRYASCCRLMGSTMVDPFPSVSGLPFVFESLIAQLLATNHCLGIKSLNSWIGHQMVN